MYRLEHIINAAFCMTSIPDSGICCNSFIKAISYHARPVNVKKNSCEVQVTYSHKEQVFI